MEERALHFSIQGEFITQMAREQFHYEGRWQYANELLESCLLSDEITDEQRQGMIIAILDGRAELRGTYPNEDYGFYYLEEREGCWSIEKTFARMKEKQKQTQKDLENLQQKYFFICENILSDYDKRKAQREYKEEYGEKLFEDMEEEGSGTGFSLLDSFMKRMTDQEEHTTEDFGWLEPDGTFHGVDWGEHQEWAQQYIEENFPDVAEGEEIDMQMKCNVGLIGAGDWLVEHGWILLHNPSQGMAFPTEKEGNRRTKAQKEFLYDYYMERDCKKEAMEIWEED